ncbi:NUDIX hydrolase [Novosphingobium album (ex Liu et al. 2023)]|uniref:CoA pyrophosphatase n=1 Tax=Novosphingobium album (ex Liu et al. 2023) TaxID=3031130 RepID=A0ABT5WW17_9SPHN|nr:CoA pyrophosphatase [Novosphingobium album (ex Liu et al. 2023)]MDE8654071.1 CoA pyrophosphatase [Novosphingobium album (ex Liu et al. 2023)]
MSALFDRVSRLFAAGHAAAPPALWVDPRITEIASFTPAAVLIAMTERERPGFLFLHRPSNMRAHAGQIAFPGGRIDPGENPVEAALREANEELGIAPEAVRVIGTTDLYRTGSAYEITPVLGIVPAGIEIRPNPTEVSQWFEAPVDFVLDPANQVRKTIDWEGRQHAFIEIDWHGHQIWGVTGAILHNLAGRLNWHG